MGVAVATIGRPLGEVLKEQLRANPANAPLLPQALAAIDTLEVGKTEYAVHQQIPRNWHVCG